eukprot:superscaffoldBa00002000_g12803
MKVAVVLVLAVFSGCHANLFYADAPKPQLEVLTDAFWDYVAKVTETADDTLEMIRKSQFGQDVSARLTESTDIASKYAVTLQEQLHPAAQELITKVTAEADVLRERMIQDLSTVRGKLEPYTEDMKAQIQQRVEQLKQELAPYTDSVRVAPVTEKVQSELTQRAQQVKELAAPYVEELRGKLDPYTQDLQSQLMTLYESFVKSS